ncbi:MAG: hypothetical protein ACI8RO_001653 [Flavobacteriales bacterium]|jgi:hypothetical protein
MSRYKAVVSRKRVWDYLIPNTYIGQLSTNNASSNQLTHHFNFCLRQPSCLNVLKPTIIQTKKITLADTYRYILSGVSLD